MASCKILVFLGLVVLASAMPKDVGVEAGLKGGVKGGLEAEQGFQADGKKTVNDGEKGFKDGAGAMESGFKDTEGEISNAGHGGHSGHGGHGGHSGHGGGGVGGAIGWGETAMKGAVGLGVGMGVGLASSFGGFL